MAQGAPEVKRISRTVKMKLTLTDKHPEVGDVVTFIFEPEGKLDWRAGQYLHYVIPDVDADDRGVERWFTVAAPPYEGHVQITTRISDKRSTFKDYLSTLKIGDTIEADGPEGDFVVDDPKRQMVLIAGGIGITPFRAILLDMDHNDTPINAKLLYANRDENFVFKDELQELEAGHSNFMISFFSGDQRIDEESLRIIVPDFAAPLFYLSGPEPMVHSLAGVLAGMGVPEQNIKLDDFPGYTWP
jgi:ferredoxin-NADP reductase